MLCTCATVVQSNISAAQPYQCCLRNSMKLTGKLSCAIFKLPWPGLRLSWIKWIHVTMKSSVSTPDKALIVPGVQELNVAGSVLKFFALLSQLHRACHLLVDSISHQLHNFSSPKLSSFGLFSLHICNCNPVLLWTSLSLKK